MALLETQAGIKMISKPFENWLKETHEKLKRRKDTNAKCTLFVETWIQDNFKTEGAKSGNPWRPISDFTKYKLRVKPSDKILQDRGWLKNRWKRFYTDQDAYIESGVDYAWKHDLGDPNNILKIDPRVHRKFNKAFEIKWPLPQRKILPVKDQVWDGIKKIYKMFFNKTLR